jgi:hypothetical protein
MEKIEKPKLTATYTFSEEWGTTNSKEVLERGWREGLKIGKEVRLRTEASLRRWPCH